MSRCPAIVEVAVVLVALKLPNVGVDVAVIVPLLFVESRELIATDERVSDGVDIDDVAVSVEAMTVPPSKKPLPATESLYPGVVLPIPTLP